MRADTRCRAWEATVVAGPSRRISQRSMARNPNAMFAALSTELHSVLVEGALPPAADLSEYYVSSRLSMYSPIERRELLERMPKDVLALVQGESDGCGSASSLEMDLIDFLLHYKHNRVVSLVGTVGVGKSTFVKYVFGNIRRLCPSLQRFFPVIINCLYIGSKKPLFRDLLYESCRAVRETLESMPNPDAIEHQAVQHLLARFQLPSSNDISSAEISSAHMIEFIADIKAICGEAIEPVIVFDNLDHLSPASVTEVVELARAVHLSTKLAILTTMRPATHAIQSELISGSGAFYNFLIDINPPDIRAVIRRRLRLAFERGKNRRIKLETGLNLEVVDPERSINGLCEKILNPRTQEVYIRDICNNNVRRALVSFERFFRYRELKFGLLFDVKADATDVLHGTWFDHLIDGLMIGDADTFVDGTGPISNILFFDDSGDIDYLILYLTLCVVGWSGRPFVKLRALGAWLERFGYKWAMSRPAIEHLLRRGLLYCPETENDIRRARNIRLSSSGEYYLQFLVENPQYIFNAIYDVPLPHEKWQDGEPDSFATRMNSVWELIEIVYARERLQLERMVESSELIVALGAIDHAGFLSGRLCRAALSLTRDAHHARSEGTRGMAREYEQRLQRIARDVADGEVTLRDELARHKLIPKHPVQVETIEGSIGLTNLIRLHVPRQLAPAKQNSVAIEVDMEGIEEAHPLVAFWQATVGPDKYGEIVELTRSAERAIYRGKFSVSDVTQISNFPESSVTLFCATDPICITPLQGAMNKAS
jgi:hypothetical protein